MRNTEDYNSCLSDWSENILPFIRNPDLQNPDLYHQRPNFRDHIFDASNQIEDFFLAPFAEAYTEKKFSDNLLRNRMLNELFYEATPVVLHEDDLNSMFYSVENRSPYLDKNLQIFSNSIPSKHLIKNGYGKYILREAVNGYLNDQVRLDKRKKGFNASINSIIDLEDPSILDYILNPTSELYEILDREKIRLLLSEKNQPNHFSKFIFNLLNAKIFLENN